MNALRKVSGLLFGGALLALSALAPAREFPSPDRDRASVRALRDAMVAQGWLAEGDGRDTVLMCAPAPGRS